MDWLVGVAPSYAGPIEHVGGWLIGMLVAVVVLVPVFRMYGVFRPRGNAKPRSDPRD